MYVVSPSAFSRRAVVSYWRKYVHEVLVNRLGGLSLPRKSVVRLTDRPDMTLDVYRGRKTTMQQQQQQPVYVRWGFSFDELAAVLQIGMGNRDTFGIFIHIFHKNIFETHH